MSESEAITENVSQEATAAITEFETMRNMAELRALSTHSLQSPLTQDQYERMMELKELVFGVGT